MKGYRQLEKPVQDNMRIGFITTMYLPNIGGAEIALRCLVDELQKRGVSLILIVPFRNWLNLKKTKSTGTEPRVFPIFPGYQILVRVVPTLAYVFLSAQLYLFSFLFKLTCWHAVGAFPIGSMVARWGRGKNPGVVVRAPGEDIQIDHEVGYGIRRNPRIDRYVRKYLPLADVLVAHSGSIEREYLALNIPAPKIVSIPNGVQLEKFMHREKPIGEVERAARSEREPFRFLFVGRNHPKKGLEVLIKAVAILKAEVPDLFVVDLIGRDVELAGSLADSLGVSEQFNFVGEVGKKTGEADHPGSELLSYFLKADVFVLPSHVESFGIVLVEAMAAGLPIITTDADGCRDVIRQGRDGLMFPRGDTKALAVAMSKMINNPAERAQLGEKARTRAKDFDWGMVAERYLEVYRRFC